VRLALNAGALWCRGSTAGGLVEQVTCGFPGDHRVRHRVSVALVVVSGLIEPAFQLDAAALLDHVSSLVRRGVQIRRGSKRNRVAERVCGRAELMRCARRRSALMDLHAGHIMMAEASLDPVEMRQRSAGAGDAATRDLGDIRAVTHEIVGAIGGPALHSGMLGRVAAGRFVRARSRGRAEEVEDRG
jgi:hypothetical protein